MTWGDANNTTLTDTLIPSPTDPLALPSQTELNTLLQIDYNIGGWGGFTHAFENETVDTWVSQDWSTYEGISFWLYGNNSGGELYLDILDNRTDDGDSCERFTYIFYDDFSGWRYFAIPFRDFERKGWQPPGAPDDGLTLTEVWAYALGFPAGVGAQTNYVDLVTVYGEVGGPTELEVQFSDPAPGIDEGGSVTVTVSLNMAPTVPVTVSYFTKDIGTTSGRDYLPASGTLVFAPGSLAQSFTVVTLDDFKYEGDETLRLKLVDPISVTLGTRDEAILTIQENDAFDPALIDDFETFPYLFDTWGNVTLSITEIMSDSNLALPVQWLYETVLSVTYDISLNQFGDAGLGRDFALGQDWTNYGGLNFWFYGHNTGNTVTVVIKDNAVPNPGPGGWTLLWSDEFDGPVGTPPDPANWTPEIGDGTENGIPGWGNAELEYYTDRTENVAMDGAGNLVITATKENTQTTPLECWYGPCEYTSARLITQDKFEAGYGRIEAWLKIPWGQGLWPAFWMLGNDIGEVSWPSCGEVDIMENIGFEPTMTHGVIHGPGYSGGDGIGGIFTSTEPISTSYHIFAIEWEPGVIRWYVDDTNFFTATVADIPAGTEWVFDHPFFILFNVAVGGYWPGYPDDSTVFPQTMHIDYVRVYGPADTAERFTYSFVDDSSGWEKISIPFTAFTRSTDQPPGAPDDGLTLTEMWGYGFSLPAGSSGSFYLDQVKLELLYNIFLPLVYKS